MTERYERAVRCIVAASLVLLALVTAAGAAAQAGAPHQGVVTGRVLTATGVPLEAVRVALTAEADPGAERTVLTDRLGRFRFTELRAGVYRARAAHVGHADTEQRVVVEDTTVVLELVLQDRPVALAGVEVRATRERLRFEREAGATVRQLEVAEIRRIPGLAEADVLRAVELLPGVISTSDFTSAYNVRGGSSDQNLILLDGLPVYNPFHLGGIFSVFNADMVARTELYAGGIPAQYGGRVSSVLSIESDAGSAGQELLGGVSLLAGRVAVGGALPDRTAQRAGLASARGRVSLRRSYFDQVLRPFVEFPYHLTDVQLYGEAWTGGGDRLSITGYTGRDVLNLTAIETFPLQLRWSWGNDVLGGRWTRTFGAGGTMETRIGYSGFATDLGFPDFDDTEFRSRINQGIARTDIELQRGSGRWRFGVEANRLAYDNYAASGGTVFSASEGRASLLGSYLQHDVRSGAWLIEVGVRVDGWLPRDGENAWIATPRAAVKRFVRNDDVAIKLAAGRYTQFVHSLRDEELPLGIDIWVLADERAPHTVSDQVQAGVEGFAGAAWSYGVEAYWRRFRGVITNNLADDPNDTADDLLGGSGLSYGGDIFVQREIGRLRPALTVAWLRATRTFPDFRAAAEPAPSVTYPPIFDRRLDADLLLRADLPRRFEASARVHIGSGLPYTRAVGSYTYYDMNVGDGRRHPQAQGGDGAIGVVLGERNAERYPLYQRVDLSVRRESRFGGGRLTWYFEVLNVLNQRNVLFYFYEYDRDPPVRSGISMFPVLPTLGVEFRF